MTMTKKLYYKALEAYDMSEDLAPLQTFLKMETVRTWNKQPKQEKKTSLKEQLQIIKTASTSEEKNNGHSR